MAPPYAHSAPTKFSYFTKKELLPALAFQSANDDPPERMKGFPYPLKPKYTYGEPLNASKGEIRLIKLLPYRDKDRWSHAIRCSMLDARSLDDDNCPPYVALSYTWGDPKETWPILLDGRVIDIPLNLRRALLHLRQKELALTLWADSICINQRDDRGEMSGQLGLMRRIYGQAVWVVAWLGIEAEGSTEAVMALDKVAKHSVFRIPQDSKHAANQLEFITGVLTERKGEGFAFPLNEVFKLFIRSWWTRVWCIQEVALEERGNNEPSSPADRRHSSPVAAIENSDRADKRYGRDRSAGLHICAAEYGLRCGWYR